MIKNLLNATKIESYSPEGTFNLMCLSDKCISNSDNSALRSRQKLFNHACLSRRERLLERLG